MTETRTSKNHSERQNSLRGWQIEYAQALATGNAEAADRVIEDVLTRRCSLAEIYSQVITPSLIRIGDLWCSHDVSVADEHLASHLVVQHLDRLISLFAWRDRLSSYRILVACVENERHWIGARMFADLCLSHGWSADFLGADVPGDSLIDIIQKRAPQVVALSATMPAGVEHARNILHMLAALGNPARVILGGQAIIEASAKRSFGSACLIARDVLEGVEHAHKFLRANRPKVILKEYLQAIGSRVRDLRLKKGWTQEQLADGARVTRVCIVAVEGGKQNVSMDIVIRLANALGVSPETLMSAERELEQNWGRIR
jgi:methanogenic corrinoid protein MtbC1/DNA-binding XRE family transcriptional regulator